MDKETLLHELPWQKMEDKPSEMNNWTEMRVVQSA
jgi:hypothetical protein